MGNVGSLNVGRPVVRVVGGRRYSTAIDRRPVEGAVELTGTGFVGDRVADSENHGGGDKAVCVYPHEHYDYWGKRLGAELPVPSFGENLTTVGLLEDEVCIGDVYRIGEATVQISQPRQPCFKLANKHDNPDLIRWINETGYTGFYLRVLKPGRVGVNDEISRTERPNPGLTVALATRTMIAEAPNAELLSQFTTLPALSASWREQMARRLAARRAEGGDA